MAFFGMGPLGSLLSGGLVGVIGIAPTFLTFGAICLAASAVFTALLPSFRKAIRPMYVRAGIFRETAEAPIMAIAPPPLEAAEPRRLAA